MKTDRSKKEKANQGNIPQKNYQANRGTEPNLGDEGGNPGNYTNNNPRKTDKHKSR